MFRLIIIKTFLLSFALLLISAQITAQADIAQKKVKVGLRNSPPFIIANGTEYSGVSVDLWERIAPSLNVDFEYVQYTDLGKMLRAIETEEIQICINPLTVTSERLTSFSFTQPYYISGMAIALKIKKDHGIVVFLRNLFSPQFLQAIFLLFGVVFTFGLIIWFIERRKNPDQFRKGWKGLGDGIWWSAVTMTTVGYGDKSPLSGWGRVVGIIWMFTAVIIISSFTAGISAALTYNKFKTDIRGLQDLRNVKVGTVRNSSTASYLSESQMKYIAYETLGDAIGELETGKIDAVVYDEPLLSYILHAKNLSETIELIPSGANSVYFGFASRNLQFLQDVNPFLLQIMESRQWRKMLEAYNLRLE